MAKKRRSSQFKDSSQVIDIEEARQKRQEKRSRQHKRVQSGQKSTPNRPVRRSIIQGKRRRNLIYTAIIIAIIAVIGVSVYNIVSLKHEQKQLISQQQELEDQKKELAEELKHLNDKDYIEEQARAQLRLVMPGEKIFVFPSLNDSKRKSDEKKETKDEN